MNQSKKQSRRWHFFSSHPVLLIDEAFHLLRTIPLRFFLVYYVGVLPFVAGLIYFVSMMLHSAYAHRYAIIATCLISGLFIWMKAWQARFSSLLWSWLGGGDPPELTAPYFLQLALLQAAIQPLGLIAVPLSLMSIIFFPPFYIFFHRASLLSARERGSLTGVLKGLFSHLGRGLLNFYSLIWISKLIWIFLFMTVLIIGMGGPYLGKAILGIDTPFSRGELSLLSGHLGWTILLASVYCLFDPLIRAIVALELFYAESDSSGVDLLADFRGFLKSNARALLIPFLMVSILTHGHAADVDPDTFEKAVRTTLKESDYSWRMPREEAILAYSDAGILEKVYRFTEENFKASLEWIYETAGDTWDWIKNTLRKWFKPRPEAPPSKGSGNWSWLSPFFSWFGPWAGVILRTLFVIVLVVLIIFGATKLFKYLKIRKKKGFVIAEPVRAGNVNIEDDAVTADQLPEDDWMLMANDLINNGDLRLGMRAMYLALLAFLGDRRLISIAKFKSNFDYVGELNRRHHELPDAFERFKDNVTLFEFAWYGMHDVPDSALQRFKDNAERIRTDVQN